MTKLDKSSRNAVHAALLIVSAIAMYGQIVSPHVKHLKAVQHYEPAIDQMINKQADIKNMLVGRRELLEDLKTQFDEIGYTIFNPEQMKEFFGSIEKLAETYDCSIAKMDLSTDKSHVIIGEASDPSHIESVETTLTVLGEYSQLISFVDCLQNLERQVWLTSLDIQTMKEQDTILRCDIIIKLYVLQKKKVEAAS